MSARRDHVGGGGVLPRHSSPQIPTVGHGERRGQWRRLHAFRRRGRAYEGGASEYGDIRQMVDFIRAVGGEDVTNVIDHETLHATTPINHDRLRSAVEAIAGSAGS